jgi:hypothetical protein
MLRTPIDRPNDEQETVPSVLPSKVFNPSDHAFATDDIMLNNWANDYELFSDNAAYEHLT